MLDKLVHGSGALLPNRTDLARLRTASKKPAAIRCTNNNNPAHQRGYKVTDEFATFAAEDEA